MRMANRFLLAAVLVVLSASESAARYEGLRPTRSYIRRQLQRHSGELQQISDGNFSDDDFGDQDFSGDSDLSPLLPFPTAGATEATCRARFKPYLQTILDTERSSRECAGGRVSFDDCCQVKFVSNKTGVYRIAGRLSWCDMSTDNGGWLVILRRADGKRSFRKNWGRYRSGFGFLNKEFWMGLHAIHEFTTSTEMEMRVDLSDVDGTEFFALYHNFSVAGPRDYYRLTVGGYDSNSTIPDSLGSHNGMQFTTVGKDHDHDLLFRRNCADGLSGGWWFHRCSDVHLNREYFHCFSPWIPCYQGVFWNREYNESISHFPWAEMKIRPAKTWRCGKLEPQGSVESYFLKDLV